MNPTTICYERVEASATRRKLASEGWGFCERIVGLSWEHKPARKEGVRKASRKKESGKSCRTSPRRGGASRPQPDLHGGSRQQRADGPSAGAFCCAGRRMENTATAETPVPPLTPTVVSSPTERRPIFNRS